MDLFIKHEQKNCPICHQLFECKVDNILNCQCYGITLGDAAKSWIDTQFSDCLCKNCLIKIDSQFVEQNETRID